MATSVYCTTSRLQGTSPYLKLTITNTTPASLSNGFAELSYTLQYLFPNGNGTWSGSKSYTIKIGNNTITGSFIPKNQSTSPTTLKSGDTLFIKTKDKQTINFSISVDFGTSTWNGVALGTRTGSGSIDIAACPTLTINYYSNYANTLSVNQGTPQQLVPPGQSKIYTQVLAYTQAYGTNPNGTNSNNANNYKLTLPNFTGSGGYLYMTRNGCNPRLYENKRGWWWTNNNVDLAYKVHQDTEFTGANAVYTLGQALGKDITQGNQSVNVYPQWEYKTVTVTFYRNQNSSDTEDAQQTFRWGATGNRFGYNTDGSGKYNPMNPANVGFGSWSKTGYQMLGWSTNRSDTTNKWSTYSNVVDTWIDDYSPAVSLYSIWKANTYTVKYNANGATGTMSNSSMTYDVSSNLRANSFTKSNYRFKNWNTKADGTGTSYTNSQSVKNLTTTNNGTVNLYAQWEPYTITLRYNTNTGSGTIVSQTFKWDEEKTISSVLDTSIYKDYYHANENGWNVESDGSGIYIPFSEDKTGEEICNYFEITTLISDITKDVYPIWEHNTLTVKYNVNGGSLETGSDYTLTNNLLYKDGEVFTTEINGNIAIGNNLLDIEDTDLKLKYNGYLGLGWSNNNQNISSDLITPETLSSEIAPESFKTNDAEVIIYALWDPYKLNIIYKVPNGVQISQSGDYSIINNTIYKNGQPYIQIAPFGSNFNFLDCNDPQKFVLSLPENYDYKYASNGGGIWKDITDDIEFDWLTNYTYQNIWTAIGESGTVDADTNLELTLQLRSGINDKLFIFNTTEEEYVQAQKVWVKNPDETDVEHPYLEPPYIEIFARDKNGNYVSKMIFNNPIS